MLVSVLGVPEYWVTHGCLASSCPEDCTALVSEADSPTALTGGFRSD